MEKNRQRLGFPGIRDELGEGSPLHRWLRACSLYANVKRELLSGDFTKLGVEAVLSGVALSLAEEIIKKSKEK